MAINGLILNSPHRTHRNRGIWGKGCPCACPSKGQAKSSGNIVSLRSLLEGAGQFQSRTSTYPELKLCLITGIGRSYVRDVPLRGSVSGCIALGVFISSRCPRCVWGRGTYRSSSSLRGPGDLWCEREYPRWQRKSERRTVFQYSLSESLWHFSHIRTEML